MPTRILEVVARRVRQARGARQWTIRDLAERSGLSVRFLVQLESGAGNISVKRLDDVARALRLSPADLLTEAGAEVPRTVALLGLRGAGKTSIGRQLARRLRRLGEDGSSERDGREQSHGPEWCQTRIHHW